MGKKHEQLTSASLFYCFIDFAMGTDASPFSYVVPAPVVAVTLAECHQAWLAMPGAQGQAHNDSDFRRFLPDYTHLEDRQSVVQGTIVPVRVDLGRRR